MSDASGCTQLAGTCPAIGGQESSCSQQHPDGALGGWRYALAVRRSSLSTSVLDIGS